MIRDWSPALLTGLLGKWEENMSMAHVASFRAGGQARYVYRPFDTKDLSRCLALIPADIPVMFVGKSTNLLFSDKGFDGVVVLMTEMVRLNRSDTFFAVEQDDQGAMLTLSAAVSCPKAAQIALTSQLVGLEFFAGIPGSIGGALTMNAGSGSASTWDFVKRVHMIDRQGKCFDLRPEDFDIHYRHVRCKYEQTAWFSGVDFYLPHGDMLVSKAKIDDIMSWRKAHQPLELPNAGSVFKNPGNASAGRLIEECGLKGFAIGGAQVSDRHANFIVNKGQATATDIIDVIRHVQEVVYQQTSIRLEPEVRIIGEMI